MDHFLILFSAPRLEEPVMQRMQVPCNSIYSIMHICATNVRGSQLDSGKPNISNGTLDKELSQTGLNARN